MKAGEAAHAAAVLLKSRQEQVQAGKDLAHAQLTLDGAERREKKATAALESCVSKENPLRVFDVQREQASRTGMSDAPRTVVVVEWTEGGVNIRTANQETPAR